MAAHAEVIHPQLADHVGPSIIDYGTNRQGLTQLRRTWIPEVDPIGVVVLMHGINEHSGRYEHVGRRLAASGLYTIVYDHQGHGGSGGARIYVERFDDFLDDAEDHLANARALDVPVILAGHSMGGLIASAYAISDRPQPDLLVLSAPALGAEVPDWQRTWAPRLSRFAPRLYVPSKFDGAILSRDPAVGEAYHGDPLIRSGGTTRLGNELFSAMDAVSASLHQIRVPTLVLHGSADALVPAATSEGFVGLDGVTRIVYPGLRHELFNEPEGPEILDQTVSWIETQLAVTSSASTDSTDDSI